MEREAAGGVVFIESDLRFHQRLCRMKRHKGQPISAQEVAQLVEARHAALVLYARSWNSDAAEDLVQNAFLKLVDQKTKPENPVAWLFRTVRNEAISRYRKQQRRKKYENDAARQREDWFLPQEHPMFSQEAAEKLRELSDERREIVLLRIWSGLTFDEIAELTGTPKTGVYRLYTAALEELRRKLS